MGFTEESEEKIKLLKNVDLVIQDEVVQMLDLTFEKSQLTSRGLESVQKILFLLKFIGKPLCQYIFILI